MAPSCRGDRYRRYYGKTFAPICPRATVPESRNTSPRRPLPYDEFYVVQLLTKAVDEVRRTEVKQLPELKRSRYLWLKDKRKWTRQQILQHADPSRMNLKTHRATRIKSLREIFQTAHSAEEAEALLNKWYSWARRCRLEPN